MMQKSTKTQVITTEFQPESKVAEIGAAIDHDLAAKMVKNYCDARPEDTPSFVVGKNVIEKILSQPGCVGLVAHKAIDMNGEHTMVYVGLDEKGKMILEYPAIDDFGKLVKVEAAVGDQNVGWNWF